MDTPVQVDANDVVDELSATIGLLHKQIAILKVQLKAATAVPTQAPDEG